MMEDPGPGEKHCFSSFLLKVDVTFWRRETAFILCSQELRPPKADMQKIMVLEREVTIYI